MDQKSESSYKRKITGLFLVSIVLVGLEVWLGHKQEYDDEWWMFFIRILKEFGVAGIVATLLTLTIEQLRLNQQKVEVRELTTEAMRDLIFAISGHRFPAEIVAAFTSLLFKSTFYRRELSLSVDLQPGDTDFHAIITWEYWIGNTTNEEKVHLVRLGTSSHEQMESLNVDGFDVKANLQSPQTLKDRRLELSSDGRELSVKIPAEKERKIKQITRIAAKPRWTVTWAIDIVSLGFAGAIFKPPDFEVTLERSQRQTPDLRDDVGKQIRWDEKSLILPGYTLIVSWQPKESL